MKKTVIHGLYFDSARKRYTHRPWINGRRTERTLDARTEREAIKEFGRLCSGVAPIHTVKSLIGEYIKAGTPGRGRTARDGEFAAGEIRRCEMLSQFFGSMRASETRQSHCFKYQEWRAKKIKKGVSGGASVDLELATLSNVFQYAVARDLALGNPFAVKRPRFRGEISHSKDHCVRSGDELHTVAKALGGTLALQFLFECCSGCRTAEALSLRHDAKIGQPGHIREEDGQRYLCIARLKQGQEDPFDYLPINPHLAKVLALLPKCSTWYFPGAHKGKHLDKDSLSHALREIAAELYPGRRLTSHGCRSFYITWQLACGVDPYQIARAVGHRSGVGLILKTYGRRLPAWAGKGFGPEPVTGATGAYWDSTTGLSGPIPVKVGASTSSNTSPVRIAGIPQSTTEHGAAEISNVIVLVPSHLAHTSTC